MPAAHRQGDSRACGGVTKVVGQSSVYANGELISVNGDPVVHGDPNSAPIDGGALTASSRNVFIEGQPVVNNSPDTAAPDSLCDGNVHCAPNTAAGSPNVFIGD